MNLPFETFNDNYNKNILIVGVFDHEDVNQLKMVLQDVYERVKL